MNLDYSSSLRERIQIFAKQSVASQIVHLNEFLDSCVYASQNDPLREAEENAKCSVSKTVENRAIKGRKDLGI